MKNKYIIVFSTSLIVLLFDQIAKFIINTNFQINQSLPLIKNIFHLTYIHNFGAGFGILKNQTLILILISIIVIGVIFYYINKIQEKQVYLQVLIGLVLGGTWGNLIDRIAYGFVIDFIDFRIWPVFNFADSFITIGVIGLIIYLWEK